jgi:hypothetical protein
MARQKLTARWVRSRHTPFRLLSTSIAVVIGLLEPYSNLMLSCTQLQIACTRASPGGVWPNSSHAMPMSSSDRQ